ncbi:hypothetical protein [Allocoleopsis sp.]|uniref:hypothetical protein n=1 Tax=Allocoleopsis sp. TaxID=3088169 RepID=UPI002FD73D7A
MEHDLRQHFIMNKAALEGRGLNPISFGQSEVILPSSGIWAAYGSITPDFLKLWTFVAGEEAWHWMHTPISYNLNQRFVVIQG